ncbi:hypothetical protein ACHAXT_008710 [Thalassiosira profunda]
MAATSEQTPAKAWHGPSPPAELVDNSSSLRLLSQGAEARVWLVTLPGILDRGNGDGASRRRTVNVGSGIAVPQLLGFSQNPSPLSPQTAAAQPSAPSPMRFICKERFPKKYRHPQLDASLTKSRTKGEARSLVRCRRAGVPCPNVLAIGHWPNKLDTAEEKVASEGTDDGGAGTPTTSSCLFLECVEGCTVRQYLEQRSANRANNKPIDGGETEPVPKRLRCEESDAGPTSPLKEERITTVIDAQTLRVARTIGMLVAKMHAAGVIHGDLTTSNIMLRNPQQSDGETIGSIEGSWEPQLVLIDFGLATSTASFTNKGGNAASGKKAKPHKQQHNAEEKAVDLYVLERAFLSTHPESELLVEEVWKGYRGYYDSLDGEKGDADEKGEGKADAAESSCSSRGGEQSMHGHVAKAVMNRLEQSWRE